jgi:putative transposase
VPKRYQVLPPTAPVPAPNDVLETLVREGGRKMLQAVLEEQVDEFLGRRRYQRSDEQRGYRNGHLPKRTIGVGMGVVEVSLPRVSDGTAESRDREPTPVGSR